MGLGLVLSVLAMAVQAAPSVTDIEFSSRPGSKFEIRLDFSETPPDMKSYTIEKPARIAIDFPNTTSALETKRYALPYGNATGVVVLESGDRTRMVVNLVKMVPYSTRVSGNSIYLVVGQDGAQEYAKQTTDPHTLPGSMDKVVEVVDNYPLRTLEKVEEVREKLAGEDGLRVEIRQQHMEMKGLVRNWQLFAAALITALSMLANILLR